MKPILTLFLLLAAYMGQAQAVVCGNDTVPPGYDFSPSKEFMCDSAQAGSAFLFKENVTVGSYFQNPRGVKLGIYTTTGGFQLPKGTTTQMNALSTDSSFGASQKGVEFFNTTTNETNTWNGSAWTVPGATPTWENTLDAIGGSLFTKRHSVDANGFTFRIENIDTGVLMAQGANGGKLDLDKIGNATLGATGSPLRAGVSKSINVAVLGDVTPSTGAAWYMWGTPKVAQLVAAKIHYPAAPIAADSTGIGYVYVSRSDTIYKMLLGTLLGYAGGGGGGTNIYNADGVITDTERYVDGNGNSLGFINMKNFGVISNDDCVLEANRWQITSFDYTLIEADNAVRLVSPFGIIAIEGNTVQNLTDTIIQVVGSDTLFTTYFPDSTEFRISSNQRININGVIIMPNGQLIKPTTPSFVDDAAAAAGNVPVNGEYYGTLCNCLTLRKL